MKKWIAVILSLCMLLGMVACGTEKTENTQCRRIKAKLKNLLQM